jgi:hypothetical protein
VAVQTADIHSFVSKELHNLLFLEEFVFARNKFTPPSSSEIEFADAVVMLGDVLIIYQIKERSPNDAGGEEDERGWFEGKVLRKATKQVRDTLRYLSSYSDIPVPNERGRVFNLAASKHAEILKVILYAPSQNLPEDCRQIQHYISKSAGFIHVINVRDYLEIARTLRVPEEVVRYLKYREKVITDFSTVYGYMSEPAMAGHFIGGQPDVPPTPSSAQYLGRLVDDEEAWNLAPLLRNLHVNASLPGNEGDYYEILLELAKLPRSMWREIKKRFLRCVEKVKKGESVLPYRITYPHTGCGFVFVPVSPEHVSQPNWKEIRVNALRNYMEAHKYDQRLSRCICILVAKDGEYFDILWGMASYEWSENPDMQQILDGNFPFRPVKGSQVHGYLFTEDDEAA